MVLIPAGEFLMGSTLQKIERPKEAYWKEAGREPWIAGLKMKCLPIEFI